MKPLFEARMRKLLPNKADFEKFSKIVHEEPRNFIRCNTLKTQPKELLSRLKKKWKISQPYPKHPEIMLVESDLAPGELGNSVEHLLGYYYIQEVSSMMSILALDPKPDELILDLFASPGSKTTQTASKMKNQGTIIANDLRIDRIKILSSNLEKNAVTNTVITRQDAIGLCSRLKKAGFRFDKILLDVPCSGEGTLRSSPKTFLMWNPKVIKSLSRQQKKFFAFAIKLLKPGGTLVYSTCTHSPEENEEVVDFALKNFPLKLETLSLPLKCRPGITEWKDKTLNKELTKTCRIYPHDNDSEGFFVSKFTLKEEVK
jgi:NOL1/NOP2/sun family putative RNA methylase